MEPKCPCPCKDERNSIHKNDKVKAQEDSTCVWWINSAKHGNYFWTYVRETSGPDGSMPEKTQTEIAKLMGWSSTRTYFSMKEAFDQLKEVLEAGKGKYLLSEDLDSDPLMNLRGRDESFE